MARAYGNTSTDDLKTAVATLSRQAAQAAATGPKRHEDQAHTAINDMLDALQQRTKEN